MDKIINNIDKVITGISVLLIIGLVCVGKKLKKYDC